MRSTSATTLVLAVLLLVAPAFAADPPPPGLTVAFIGDQGAGPGATAVLQLIEDEGADAVLHAGDFDYHDDPAGWEALIDGVLGPDFPYFAVIGNHDLDAWYVPDGYQERIEARMTRLGVSWDGDMGVRSTFTWQGLRFVMTSPGLFSPGDPGAVNESYIRYQLAEDDSLWRISTWHVLQRDMQVGGKGDQAGWGVYEASREGGAIIATAHEHSYSRTHLLERCEEPLVASFDEPLVLTEDDPATVPDEGRTFAFVSGLAGNSIRDQQRDEEWWASVYTSTQGATHGALFGVFHVDGDPRRAYFYFKDVDGNVIDEFTVVSTTGDAEPPTPECADGIDNDGDGRIDAAEDPGCTGPDDFRETSTSLVCDDGVDNDGDGLVDVASDPGCADPEFPFEDPACQDGVDNDVDGFVDWDGAGVGAPDPECTEPWLDDEGCLGPCPAVCGDGVLDPGEACDDGNTIPGDGCDAACAEEFDAPTASEVDCLLGVGRRAGGVTAAQGRLNRSCIAAAAKGKEGDADACLAADAQGRVARSAARTLDAEASRCDAASLPDFGHTSASQVNGASQAASLAFTRDLLGAGVQAGVVTKASDAKGAKCQRVVLKSAHALVDRLFRDAYRAERAALAGKRGAPVAPTPGDLTTSVLDFLEAETSGKWARKVARLEARATRVCGKASTPLAQLFPGSAAADPAALSAASAERARCRWCRAWSGYRDLAPDCDRFDDGAANASCL